MDLRSAFKRLRESLAAVGATGEQVARGKAVETLQSELEELENIFGVLVLGSFVGVPSPPMQVSLDLMPFMERELGLMLQKVDTANEPMAELFSVFDID